MATRQISVQGVSVSINAPYAEGHTLNEAEAAVLNQTRGENVSNNTRKQVKEILEKAGGEEVTEATAAEVQAVVSAYDEGYTLAVKAVRRASIPPAEKIALDLARQAIRQHLAETGRKVKDIEKEVYEAEVARIAGLKKVKETAAELLAAQQKSQKVASKL